VSDFLHILLNFKRLVCIRVAVMSVSLQIFRATKLRNNLENRCDSVLFCALLFALCGGCRYELMGERP
ncbi:MAG: hypothetical protein J6U43_00290, partial [Bacteroidales bacterium]|nr:hypothetical protein [Bacteroidales bacterium]